MYSQNRQFFKADWPQMQNSATRAGKVKVQCLHFDGQNCLCACISKHLGELPWKNGNDSQRLPGPFKVRCGATVLCATCTLKKPKSSIWFHGASQHTPEQPPERESIALQRKAKHGGALQNQCMAYECRAKQINSTQRKSKRCIANQTPATQRNA